MDKDPAFLFYSNDFYEGTRTMYPEERACFIDLMIYQHQHGIIPNDLKRLLLYCNGVNKATLQTTLEAKFKLTDKGWINEKLNDIIELRKEYSGKQSQNGIIGQFFKKAKSILNKNDYHLLRKTFENQSKEELINKIKDLEINEATLQALLEASLKHLEIEIEIENINKDNNKDNKVEKKEEFSMILEYPLEKVKDIILNDQSYIETLSMNNHITGIKTIQYVEEFCKKLENEGINEKSIRDFKSHFARWLNIELKKESQSKPLQSEREKRMEGVRQLKADSAAILEHLNIKLS